MIYESYSNEDTKKIAHEVSQKSCRGDVYCISGDLGTGKTIFTKGFAEGLGIQSQITSPTFTIINEYNEGRIPLYHFDVYRVGGAEGMEDTGWEDYFYGNGVTIVEWGELIEELLPAQYFKILIEKDLNKGDNYRKISIFKDNQIYPKH